MPVMLESGKGVWTGDDTVSMNILQVNAADEGGGAEKVAYDLHKEFNERPNIRSELLVGEKNRDEEGIEEIPYFPGERFLTTGIERVLSLEGFGAPSSRILLDRAADADVVHLHNLHGGYFNLLALDRIPDDTPIVWTLHDMWQMTGNCVYSMDCSRYQESCGQCPQLKEYPKLRVDTTSLLLRIKNKIFSDRAIHFVGPSKWILEKLRKSRISDIDASQIPNGVDINHFTPRGKDSIRSELDISDEESVLLFLASSLDAPRKGGKLLLDAIDQVEVSRPITLLAVGKGTIPRRWDEGVRIVDTGFVDYQRLPDFYAVADVFVIPSIAENFPLVVLEAMACETPVVGLPVGGIPEQIPRDTGFICNSATSSALAQTLTEILTNTSELGKKGRNARERVLDEYRLTDTASSYLSQYDSLTEV